MRVYTGAFASGAPRELLETVDALAAESPPGGSAFVPSRYDALFVPLGGKPKAAARRVWPEDAELPPPRGGRVSVDAELLGDDVAKYKTKCGFGNHVRIGTAWYDVQLRAAFRQQALWLNEAAGLESTLRLLRGRNERLRAEGRARLAAALKEDPSLKPKLLKHRRPAVRRIVEAMFKMDAENPR